MVIIERSDEHTGSVSMMIFFGAIATASARVPNLPLSNQSILFLWYKPSWFLLENLQ